ncbi:MAG: hypothetical protein QXX36_01120 [Candidatus Rehaiarchaeum fermentans]|nr:hypothetical protein [Candidatus Rehaiarchaeum fermentans]MCW1302215.1 hypothetical protein [Candidatus Rehaiarchaeum fermentans]
MISTYISKSISKENLLKYAEKRLDQYNWGEVYKSREDGVILVPGDYPNSITNLVFCLSISDKAIVRVDKTIDKFDAEIALAIEYSSVKEVVLDKDEFSDLDNYFKFFKGLLVTSPKREISNENFSSFSIVKNFVGKGIGAIAIGFNTGKLMKGQTLYTYPELKQVMIKEIQLMDNSLNEVESHNYVGLALSNIKAEELGKALISTKDVVERKYDLIKSEYFKSSLTQLAFISNGIKLETRKENLFSPIFENIEVFSPSLDKNKNRIVGKAKLVF